MCCKQAVVHRADLNVQNARMHERIIGSVIEILKRVINVQQLC